MQAARSGCVGVGAIVIAIVGSAVAGCGNTGSVPAGTTDAGADATTGTGSSDSGAAADAAASPGHLSLSAASLDFGLEDCGGRAVAAQTLTLTNQGGAPLTWSASLDSVLFFTITGPSSGTIAPGASTTVTITPSPMPGTATAGATESASIALATSDPSAGVTFIPVTATASGATFAMTPSAADFGTVSVGTQAPDIALTLLNVGNAAAQVSFAPPTDSDFSLVSGDGDAGTSQSVAPGAAVPGLTARFKPSNANPSSTSSALTVTGAVCGDATSITSIPLTGQGTTGAASLSPGLLDFGSVNCGTTAPFAITTLFNSGNASYTWTAALAAGPSSPYTVTPSSGTLFAGAQAQIFVTPKAIPSASAITPNLYGDTLTVTTSIPSDTPHQVPLQETAQGAILSVTTTPLGYGTIAAFSGSSAQSLVVTNNGNIAANVQVTPGTSSFTTTSGSAAAGGGTFTSSVDFTPAQLGPITDSIAITSSTVLCQPLPGAVAVSGTGMGVSSRVEFAGMGKHRGGQPVTSGGCAILPAGHLACWGDNSYGEQGNGTTISASANPSVVPGLSGVTAIAAGGDSNCAVHAGTVSCWGNNKNRNGRSVGKLGIPGLGVAVPTAVPGVTGATDVVLGHNIGCALQSTGNVFCWGTNAHGNLGTGGATGNAVIFPPTLLPGLSNAIAITAGGGGACALLANNAVECWGDGNRGQLANAGADSNIPVAVPGLNVEDDAGADAGPVATSVKAFGAGARSGFRCVLLSDNTVSCWGNTAHGGTATSTSNGTQNTLIPVPTISTATQLSLGYGFACVVLQGGGVSCWGRNDAGQLGNGLTADSATPVTVAGITNAVQVTAGDSGACALLATGSISCWGNDGISTSATPTTLPGF